MGAFSSCRTPLIRSARAGTSARAILPGADAGRKAWRHRHHNPRHFRSSITPMRFSRLRSLRLDPHRQREIERRSLAGLGFHPDAPAVHLDDALGDRQAETGSTLLARDRAVGLLELLEDFGLIDRGNTGARVAYRDRERSVRG